MASNLSKVTMLRSLQARAYSHAAPISGITCVEVKNTTLPNKLVISSAENASPLCRIAIFVKAGSRNESVENLGVAHVVRIAAGLSTKNATQFAITRHIQQAGASLYCTSSREKIGYILEGTRSAVEEVMPFLTEVCTQQVFKPWEIKDQEARLRLELATRPPQQRAVDLLHKAAYRQGLGNSLYIAKHQIGKVNSETLQHYFNQTFKTGNSCVLGLGVEHSALSAYGSSLKCDTGAWNQPAAAYKGGEIRSDKGGDYAFIAMATEGGNWSNSKESFAFGVLHKIMGDGPLVKRGNSSGILGRAAGPGHHAINALNVNYSDSGLFGVLIAAEAKDAGALVEKALTTLKAGRVAEEDVMRGKNQLIRDVLCTAEDGSDVLHCMASQALYKGSVRQVAELIEEIESLTSADINAAAAKVANGKLSIASVGNLRTVPFLDEIK